jgi:acetyltransferase-like isoleucine patch superfamily enzyme
MSAFTALNGGSPKTTEPPAVATTDKTATAEDGPSTSAAATQPQLQPQLQPQPQQQQQQQPQSASDTVPSVQRESWSAPSADRSNFQSPTYPDVESSHKRKRSNSIESQRDHAVQERTPDTATVPAHSDSRDPYGTPQREYRHYDDHRDKDSWYSHQNRGDRSPYDTQQNSATSTQGHTDDQISDTLRRAASHPDHGDYPQTSPDGDDRSMLYGSSYGSEHRQDSMLAHDPKKRKRNFSNRTKTGCLTCRKRKKKCDEQKPECSNCIRGGFLCAGYPPQRGPGWQKPENKAAAVPLESKDPSYVPPGAYGMPQQAQAQAQAQTPTQAQAQAAAAAPYGSQAVKRESMQHYRGHALRIDPPQGRPLVTDDDRPTASTIPSASVASPDNKLSAMSSYTPGNAFPTPVSANTQPLPFGERMGKEYTRVPPLHDLSRTEPETPRSGNHLPQINILHPTRTNSPAPPAQSQTPVSNAQVAQLALSHPQFPQRRTQKEEMLSGRNYYPFDKELCLERERCAAACWRFNSLTTPPTNGISPEERARLFLEILQPRDPVRVSPTEASPVTNKGRVGRHVAVETPFTCDYGYNISIGNHVVIGRNCTINDVCEVKIGDNCVIGPNVSIFTATLPIDPKKRQGGQGPQTGRGITIEQDCWIGGGAIILPGRTIGKGSTVGAGSIVTKDVPPFTIVAGNPARVLRGIAS